MDRAAVINNNKIENVIMIAPAAVIAFKEAIKCEHLIPCDDTVEVGDTYDPETGIISRDGVRIFPQKTVEERIAELEQTENDTQLALIELANMIAGGDA